MIKKIAITGSIASGKSTLLRLIQKLGYPTLSCDEIVHKLYSQKEVQREIISLGGEELYNKKTHTINRSELLKKILKEPDFKKRLEDFLHPLVWKEIEAFFKTTEAKNFKISFVEVPLLYEVEWENKFDEVWVIFATPETQKKRIKEKPYSHLFLELLKTQLPLELKIRRANRVFSSEKSLQELEEELKHILKNYL